MNLKILRHIVLSAICAGLAGFVGATIFCVGSTMVIAIIAAFTGWKTQGLTDSTCYFVFLALSAFAFWPIYKKISA
jgi:hypothetical protein